MLPPKAVYIHIPFCTHKCHYCDFTAYVAEGQPIDEYLTALGLEMKNWVESTPPHQIESIFIGGGTPTILSPAQMARLLEMICTYFPDWSEQMEFTIEANPGTTQEELLAVMYAGGINRISFGAQTFRPSLLTHIGRVHGVAEIIQSVQLARKAGFENLSLDLMFGLPKQRVEDMEHALWETMALQPEHLSCYSLKVEEGTLFYHMDQQGKLPLPNEEEEFQMYQLTRNFLQDQGYRQYEISNFSRHGKESVHNSFYWKNEEFYGLGAGAHGYVANRRYANVKTIREYLERNDQHKLPIADYTIVTKEEQMENFMMLGLRLMDGVSEKEFNTRYHLHIEQVFGTILQSLFAKGLLYKEKERIKLSEKGILFGNDVFAAFLP